jgi:L-alanine-DL-glutamate epimerase-like enolase superfamily enzyme
MHYTTGYSDPPQVPVIVVEIVAGGACGFGEFVPTSILYPPGHMGRAWVDEWAELARLGESLIGQDARQLRRLIPTRLDAREFNSLIDGIDFAVHDLVGRLSGLPVWALLGGREQPWVWGMPVVHTDTPDGMADRALDYCRLGGYQWYKLKPSADIEQDRQTMIRIREKVGQDVRFFVDPNYALKTDAQGAIQYINALAPHGIDTDWAGYRRIQEGIEVHLMLDDKARTPEAVLAIVNERCAKVINIHANWASGFAPAIHKARVAALGGLDTIIGSTFYTGPGAAAYQTLAAVIPGRHICEQTNASDDVKRVAVTKEYACVNGKIQIPDAPGLGIEIDREALDAMTQETVRIGKAVPAR